jgi:hypothetical protein
VLPEASLSRILITFEEELLAASDEEIMVAAKDLGMDPAMKGSAAFFGLTRPWPFDLSQLDMRTLASLAKKHLEAGQPGGAISASPRAESSEPRQLPKRRSRKDRPGK